MKRSPQNRTHAKPLISRRSASIFDALNPSLTNLESLAMQKAWRILEPKLRSLSTDILMNLYSEHYEIMEKFRDESGKLCNYELINYATWLLRLYGSIINNKVDPIKTKKILEPLIEKLKKYSMDVDCVKLQLEGIKHFIFAELRNALSPTSIEAFNKLHNTIIRYVYIKLN
ncbi:uncharacterized protein LOC120782772 [Bactrocera tryoni]|uniref:uncharacterized protein LOC120782772 n=1 Tax=Bactrocera tryoni TaxID=59916 RepID=UPI001A95926A|nr:uncharacterized protein LOC120782772 [Bactrocera tryoni]